MLHVLRVVTHRKLFNGWKYVYIVWKQVFLVIGFVGYDAIAEMVIIK